MSEFFVDKVQGSESKCEFKGVKSDWVKFYVKQYVKVERRCKMACE